MFSRLDWSFAMKKRSGQGRVTRRSTRPTTGRYPRVYVGKIHASFLLPLARYSETPPGTLCGIGASDAPFPIMVAAQPRQPRHHRRTRDPACDGQRYPVATRNLSDTPMDSDGYDAPKRWWQWMNCTAQRWQVLLLAREPVAGLGLLRVTTRRQVYIELSVRKCSTAASRSHPGVARIPLTRTRG